jgi:thiol-disulfide isomerase/thioredoxin
MGAITRAAWPRLAVLAAVLVLAACRPGPPAPAPLVEGRAFPAFMLNDVLRVPQSAYRDKTLVLNIWATWCGPCRREMPDLERLSRRLDPQRFAVLGLSVDRDPLLVAEFLMRSGVSFANLLDQDGKMSKQLGLEVYPQTFLIARDGTLLRRLSGWQDWNGAPMLATLEAADRGTRGDHAGR